jgi:hypothetical protein
VKRPRVHIDTFRDMLDGWLELERLAVQPGFRAVARRRAEAQRSRILRLYIEQGRHHYNAALKDVANATEAMRHGR